MTKTFFGVSASHLVCACELGFIYLNQNKDAWWGCDIDDGCHGDSTHIYFYPTFYSTLHKPHFYLYYYSPLLNHCDLTTNLANFGALPMGERPGCGAQMRALNQPPRATNSCTLLCKNHCITLLCKYIPVLYHNPASYTQPSRLLSCPSHLALYISFVCPPGSSWSLYVYTCNNCLIQYWDILHMLKSVLLSYDHLELLPLFASLTGIIWGLGTPTCNSCFIVLSSLPLLYTYHLNLRMFLSHTNPSPLH